MSRKRHAWSNRRGRTENWRGPRRALTLDEQLEVQRAMREALYDHRRGRTADTLALRYGVSTRTIWRYAETVPVPPGLEFLRMRLTDWSNERDLRLTTDDMATLLLVIQRHRDFGPPVVDPEVHRLSATPSPAPPPHAMKSL